MIDKQLRVWHIPQVPGTPFYVDVATVDEAMKILVVLAYYDCFQFEHNIKPDYSNASGLEEWHDDVQEWWEWEDYNTGNSIWALITSIKEK